MARGSLAVSARRIEVTERINMVKVRYIGSDARGFVLRIRSDQCALPQLRSCGILCVQMQTEPVN